MLDVIAGLSFEIANGLYGRETRGITVCRNSDDGSLVSILAHDYGSEIYATADTGESVAELIARNVTSMAGAGWSHTGTEYA